VEKRGPQRTQTTGKVPWGQPRPPEQETLDRTLGKNHHLGGSQAEKKNRVTGLPPTQLKQRGPEQVKLAKRCKKLWNHERSKLRGVTVDKDNTIKKKRGEEPSK